SLGSRGRHDLAERLVSHHRWATRDQLIRAYQRHTQSGERSRVTVSPEAHPQEVGYRSPLAERGPPSLVANYPRSANPPPNVLGKLLAKEYPSRLLSTWPAGRSTAEGSACRQSDRKSSTFHCGRPIR